MITAIALSTLVSFGTTYGFHLYKQNETKQQIVLLEEKYAPLLNDCYTSFVTLASELIKDKEALFEGRNENQAR